MRCTTIMCIEGKLRKMWFLSSGKGVRAQLNLNSEKVYHLHRLLWIAETVAFRQNQNEIWESSLLPSNSISTQLMSNDQKLVSVWGPVDLASLRPHDEKDRLDYHIIYPAIAPWCCLFLCYKVTQFKGWCVGFELTWVWLFESHSS